MNVKQLRYISKLYGGYLSNYRKSEIQDILRSNIISMYENFLNSKHSKNKILKGMGISDFISSLGSKAREFENRIRENVDLELLKKAGTKAFQLAANEYRRKNCNGMSRDLLPGEFHYGCHNYTGPGTILNEKNRIFPPYNDIDNCSRTHDLEYENIGKNKNLSKEQKALEIMKSDMKATKCYNNYSNEDGYHQASLGINGKLGIETLLSIFKGKPSTIYGGKKRVRFSI